MIAAGMTATAVVTASMSFTVLVIVVVTVNVRIKIKLAVKECGNSCVCIAGNTAVQLDVCSCECHLSAAADTAAD